MNRIELVEQIITAKLAKGLTWAAIAKAVGRHEVWTTSALLGQQSMSKEEATTAVDLLGIRPKAAAVALLMSYPNKAGEVPAIPTDPLIYRFYEMIQVYGPTMKEVIQEKMGDGIMSAIDFTMDIQKLPDPKGDRVVVTLNGKFLPYKKW